MFVGFPGYRDFIVDLEKEDCGSVVNIAVEVLGQVWAAWIPTR